MSERLSLILVIGALWLSHPCEGSDEEIVTKRLVIVDSENRPRIVADAGDVPSLVFKSESGKNLIRIAIGGDEGSFGFDLKDVPHLTLETETGQTELTIMVSPAPEVDGLDSQFSVEMASVSMHSTRDRSGMPDGKFLSLGLFPNKAVMSIATMSPDKPAGMLDPDVQLLVGPKGTVTTNLTSQGRGK